MIKYFRFSYDYVLWEISFTNLNMLLATIPKYEADKKDKDKVEGGENDVKNIADFLNIK